MKKMVRELAVILAVAGFFGSQERANAGLGEFFKKVGNSIVHPQPHSKRKQPPKKGEVKSSNKKPSTPQDPEKAVGPQPVPATPDAVPVNLATPAPTPLPSQAPVRAVPARTGGKRDIPFGVPIPNRPGFVTSPYAPNQGPVDVRGFPSGVEVKDPFTNKIFLTP